MEDSRALAALRIVVALLILVSPELHQGEALAAHPDAWFVPEGAGWLAALQLGPAAVRGLRLLALTSGALALLGFHTRVALAVLTCAALPVYALSQFRGTVLHDMHLFWFSSVLALSPCGDVWSLDAWGNERTRPALDYAIPATVCRALLGLIYFFPGLHKLLVGGWQWGSAAHVIAQMHAKWFQWGELPVFRLDHYSWLCSITGHAVPLFELGFLPLVLWRPTRSYAALLGLGFHWANQAFLYIPFVSLWACYVVLVPWGRRRVHRGDAHRSWPVLAWGGALIALVSVQGFRARSEAWPVACYPTFAQATGDTLPDLLVEFSAPHAAPVRLTGREQGPRSQAEWGRIFRMSGAYGDRPAQAALREHALAVAANAQLTLAPGSIVRVYRARYATAPERWHEPPSDLVLLSELATGS